MVTTRPPKTIVKPTALGPVANTDTKLLIYGLFGKGRVLAQDAVCLVISSPVASGSIRLRTYSLIRIAVSLKSVSAHWAIALSISSSMLKREPVSPWKSTTAAKRLN